MRESKDIYEPEPRITKVGNNIAKVFRPILTDEERERRMNNIKKCAVDLVLKGQINDENNQNVQKSPLVG